jgi:thiopeptide-type bacteriocin biosynthesis protein
VDDPRPWRQANITFPDWAQAENTMSALIAPVLAAVEKEGLTGPWFFIRKHPCWRVRYQPAAAEAEARIGQHLDQLAVGRKIGGWTTAIYEPEVHAFGGTKAMTAAHHLFHQDSRCLLAYLQEEYGQGAGHRREMSIMLCSILMRAAGQDWYEQGDIWARVAAHRDPPTGSDSDTPSSLHVAVRRLMSVDAESQMCAGAPLASAAQWAGTYAAAGRELAGLAAMGELHRGLRDVLAHHVIFAWNRIGLPYQVQVGLAATARTVVFGPNPATSQTGGGEEWSAQKIS